MQSKLNSVLARFGLPIISDAVIVRLPFRTCRRDNTFKSHLARVLETALPVALQIIHINKPRRRTLH